MELLLCSIYRAFYYCIQTHRTTNSGGAEDKGRAITGTYIL